MKEALKEPSDAEKLRYYEENPKAIEDKIRAKVDTTRVINFPPIQRKELIIRKPPPPCPIQEANETYQALNSGPNSLIYLDHDNLEGHFYKR